MSYEITIEHEPGRYLAVTRFDARPEEIGPQAGAALGTVAAQLGSHQVPITGPAVCCYEMAGDAFHVSAGFVVDGPFEPVDGVEPWRLPEVDVATATHVGPYEQLGQAYDALREGVAEQGRQVEEAGPMWEEYLTGPETPPDRTVTVVHWPLRPA